MADCKHETLTLVVVDGARLRCRHCHLTISAEELGGGCCPECLEAHNVRRKDFEEVSADTAGKTRYCCEECGLVIDC